MVERPEARRSRAIWLAPAILFLTGFGLFALTARHGGGSWDYYTANYAAWHLVHTGSPWLDGSWIPGLVGDPEAGTWIRQAPNGHTVISRFPGVIAINLPAYWLAGANTMTVVPGAITAAFAGALTLMLTFLSLRTVVSDLHAGMAALALGFATPIWTISADATWPHTVTVLGIAGIGWAAATRRWWLVGVFGGITLWGRLHAVVIVAVVGLLLAWWRRSPRIAVVAGLWSSIFLGLTSVWTHWIYGSWDPIASYGSEDVLGYIPQGLDHVREELAMWIAPDRGILVWTPVVALLLPGLVRGWREVPDWARALLLGGLAYTVLQGWMRNGVGGDSFYGYRLGLEFVAAATPALAVSVSHAGRIARRLLVPLLTLQVVAFGFGAVVDVFLRKTDAWHDNAFAYAMRESWPGGPVLVALVWGALMVLAYRLSAFAADRPQPRERQPSSVPLDAH